jgi:hypothetical protein
MRIEIKPSVKKTVFVATYHGTGEDHGKKYKWKFYREGKWGWFLEDYEGTVRHLAENWRESVPVIHRILSCHDMTANVS